MKVFLFFILLTGFILPQCSDAGVCSVGGHQEMEDESGESIGLSYQFGISGKEEKVKFYSIVLSSRYRLFDKTGIYASLPYNIQSGPLGDVSGIGDLIVLLSQDIYSSEYLNISLQAGAKFATGSDNAEGLHQIYQSGLGSNDLLLGVNLNYLHFNFGAAYQLAGKRNSNILKLKRGDDLLIRGGYTFSLIQDLKAALEILFIKRMQESSIISAGGNSYASVPESDHSQVNIAGTFLYNLNPAVDISLFAAVPVINRDINLDGLKRTLSIAAGINVKI